MQSIKINKGNNEDEVETAQSQIMLLLNPMISQLLPVLNATHQLLKKRKSRLQSLMRSVYRKICTKHPDLLEKLGEKEPILASEIQRDISMTKTPEQEHEEELSPVINAFRSPLLPRIARTPKVTSFPITDIVQLPISILNRKNNNHNKISPITFHFDDSDDFV
jgi:hypothetical protein